MAREVKSDNLDTIIGPGADIEGTLTVRGSMRLDGKFKGKILVNGTFILGKTGQFDGELNTKNAIIGGRLKGKIKVEEKIEFESGARFEGDLICKGLIVNDGVIFDGTCAMSKGPGVGSFSIQRNQKEEKRK